MAGRKEYGVDFMLNAALNGNFKGAFSSAQTEFAKLGNEIRDLNRKMDPDHTGKDQSF